MIFGTHFLVWLNLLIGIALLIYGITLLVRENRRCVQEVEAVCINVRRVRSSDRSWADIYNPILEYEWQGKKYVVENDSTGNTDPDIIGETCKVMIDPEHPERFCRKGSPKAILITILGAIYTAAVVGLIVLEKILFALLGSN